MNPENGLKLNTISSSSIKIKDTLSNENGTALKIKANDKCLTVLPENNLDFFIQNNSEGYFVSYLDYAVLAGSWSFSDKSFSLNICPGGILDFNFLQKIRIFNESFELLLARNFITSLSGARLSGRIRMDKNDGNTNSDNKIDVIDCSQIIFGTRAEQFSDSNWLKLTEERGTEIILPASVIDGKNINNLGTEYLVAIKIRNYIGYHGKTSQAYYTDHRFMNFQLIDIPNEGA